MDPVPEPGSLALALLGLGAAAIVRRRGRGAIWCAAARRYFAAAST
ncbi:MAG: PEP-CTERM sorting domain-containing protein [Proteobacteria bacterium]|nr:PEP-CTERM sorting domain-containing protein [Pseudomonadota bacterium]